MRRRNLIKVGRAEEEEGEKMNGLLISLFLPSPPPYYSLRAGP
jgi:hypothetical protein